MTLDEIKKINIREYLIQMGFNPAKENSRRGMFHSPLREDKNESFSVDYIRNLWFDHGLGKGGSIIDLVFLLENCTVAEAIKKLESGSFSFHRNSSSCIIPPVKQEPVIQITEVKELTDPALLNLLNRRCIDAQTAGIYCKEVHYAVNGRSYMAIGFQNDSGGWILRNDVFKGCTSMDITTLVNTENNKNICLTFEGFMDYLSYLVLKNIHIPRHNTIVLNSVVNLPKAIGLLKRYKDIYTYLDNDDAGRKTTALIKDNCSGCNIHDQSSHYARSKDLNDYLVSMKQIKQTLGSQLPRKPSKGLRM